MLRPLLLACAAALVVGCGPANGQNDPADGDGSRSERIVANLKYEFPTLERLQVEVDSLRPSGIDGLDEGVLTVNGDSQPFYVTEDDSRLFLLAAPAIDASRTDAEIAEARTAATAASSEEARARAAEIAAATAGLPAKGPADAPVTVVEFSDFECSFCMRASSTVQQLLAQYPEDVRLVYAHFPLDNHPWAKPAAIAASCAAQQDVDAFWALHDAYFADQRGFSPDNVVARSRAVASAAGLDMGAWEACAATPSSEAYRATAAAVDQQMALGAQYGVQGTPAFFVNGEFLSGAQPLEAFVAAVERAKAE